MGVAMGGLGAAEDLTKRDWHALEVDEVLEILGTSWDGLGEEEARRRLSKYGWNELREEKGKTALEIFIGQFKSFLIIILLIATLTSLIIGEVVDATVIFAIVIASAILGFIQEYRAEKSLEALKKMTTPTATVVRDGLEREIPAREVVPGDILILRAGDRVPADARVIESVNLDLDEAMLTGESTPVRKSVEPLPKEATMVERKNIVYAGTVVTYGKGRGVIYATGMRTELGKIAEMIQTAREVKTPLEERLEHVGRWLGIISLIVCAVVASLGLLRGYPLLEMLLWGVSLAVAAVPEALPAVVTGALAIGVQRMAKRRAIVRKLPAVETLGCTTIICTDKTGTLTKGEMTVRRIYLGGRLVEVTGVGYEPIGDFLEDGKVLGEDRELVSLMRVAALCCDACIEEGEKGRRVIGDPTEGAIIVAAAKLGLSKETLERDYPRIGEIPFSSERKRMTTIHSTPEGRVLISMKGAPEVVLERCSHIEVGGVVKGLDEELKEEILEVNGEMAASALRVLGVAYKEQSSIGEDFSEEEVEKNLIFLGLLGMIDPPREGVDEAIRLCERAGVKVVMVTGDHKLTALAIAKEIGLLKEDSLVLTGAELDRMGEKEYGEVVEQVAVYARVSPEHKLKIVKALKKRGHIVAVTGDGVNDAPALKYSDIGISMGITGTEVAKEASDMVLADDNFTTIVAAIEEGRGIYDNIKKYLTYLLSCNIGEILVMLVAGLLGWPLPLLAVQILWVNLTTDGLPAIALGVDPPDPDIMDRPPRDPQESIFTKPIKIIIGFVALVMTLVLVSLFGWALNNRGVVEAQTLVFATMVFFELARSYSSRSQRHPVLKIGIFKNRFLNIAVFSSIILQLLVIEVPAFDIIFETAPLSLSDWALILPLSLTGFLGTEIIKYLLPRLGGGE